MKSIKTFAALILGVILFNACASNEIGDSKDVSQDKIYQSYFFTYKEGESDYKLYSQFRFGGKNGTTLVLNNPSKITLDGDPIPVDSSTALGAFYQSFKPSSGFLGNHTLVFTNTNGSQLENKFTLDNFSLLNVPESVSKKKSFALNFNAGTIQPDDYIDIVAIDTDSSFDFTHHIKSDGNTIPLLHNTGEGGILQIEYALKPVKIKLEE
jgi:hypothetical protein